MKKPTAIARLKLVTAGPKNQADMLKYLGVPATQVFTAFSMDTGADFNTFIIAKTLAEAKTLAKKVCEGKVQAVRLLAMRDGAVTGHGKSNDVALHAALIEAFDHAIAVVPATASGKRPTVTLRLYD